MRVCKKCHETDINVLGCKDITHIESHLLKSEMEACEICGESSNDLIVCNNYEKVILNQDQSEKGTDECRKSCLCCARKDSCMRFNNDMNKIYIAETCSAFVDKEVLDEITETKDLENFKGVFTIDQNFDW